MENRQRCVKPVRCRKRRAAVRICAYRGKGEVAGFASTIIGGCSGAVVVKAKVSPMGKRSRARRLRARLPLPSNASISIWESWGGQSGRGGELAKSEVVVNATEGQRALMVPAQRKGWRDF